MSKGDTTRAAILDTAVQVASRIGFKALSIGLLAEEAQMSKSGVFSHFKSKEQLQLQTLEHARQRFVDVIVRPALAAPRGEPRLRALVDHWRTWDSVGLEGGCIFTGAAFELGEQPGPLRDALVRSELDWLELLSSVTAAAVREGQFRSDLDPEQLAFEIHGVLLSHHYTSRLLADEQAGRRTELALDRIIAGARAGAAMAGTPLAAATR